MSKSIAVRIDEKTRKRLETLANENGFAAGNQSAYLRGLINNAWEERELINEALDKHKRDQMEQGKLERHIVIQDMSDGSFFTPDQETENKMLDLGF